MKPMFTPNRGLLYQETRVWYPNKK